ncbi:MAG TPA: DNA polymerase Y family protein [Burkholderiales bacterium]|nr:DNA polymerase Y family protein [Burkholderiales bacterium]
MLWVALHFRRPPPATIETLAGWACQFTPRVSLEPPDALLAEVSGSLRYFGGVEALLAMLRDGLGELGVDASLATAHTPRAALWLARAGRPAELGELPLEVTRWPLDFFRSIGVATLGELARLPRAGLARRCPAAVLAELDAAHGRREEPREFFVPPQRFDARLELPAEALHAEALAFAARRLLVQLAGLLAARHAGIRGFVLHLADGRGRATPLAVNLASPSRDVERFVRLLRERLAAQQLREPVQAIRVEAGDFAALPGASGGFFGDAAGEGEDWAQLAERLQARLGRDAVHGIATVPEHRPEHAWRRIEPGDWDPHEFRSPGPRPAWLLESPRRLEPGRFALLLGPERIECGWWDGDEAKRDYFVARLAPASLAWIYREDGEWYLHGLFA